MIQRKKTIAAVTSLVLLVLAIGQAEARTRYRYGSRSRATSAESQGFFLNLEGTTANPRNTDNTVATFVSSGSPSIPDWDDELATRVEGGFTWSGGNKVIVSFWDFDSEVRGTGASSIFLAVGPPPPGGDTGTSHDITTKIRAQTMDLAWARSQELGDAFTMEWSMGLRYAEFEETLRGTYGGAGAPAQTLVAAKSNLGEMVGARAAVRGNFQINSKISFTGSIGFSMLDGEGTASSSLTPSGSTVATTSAALKDDSRSGSVRDFDIGIDYRLMSDSVRIRLGWEQSEWNQIASDLMRNFPGTSAPLRDRDSVVFSGYKIGLHLRF